MSNSRRPLAEKHNGNTKPIQSDKRLDGQFLYFGLKEDGIFGHESFNALITFMKRYGDE